MRKHGRKAYLGRMRNLSLEFARHLGTSTPHVNAGYPSHAGFQLVPLALDGGNLAPRLSCVGTQVGEAGLAVLASLANGTKVVVGGGHIVFQRCQGGAHRPYFGMCFQSRTLQSTALQGDEWVRQKGERGGVTINRPNTPQRSNLNATAYCRRGRGRRPKQRQSRCVRGRAPARPHTAARWSATIPPTFSPTTSASEARKRNEHNHRRQPPPTTTGPIAPVRFWCEALRPSCRVPARRATVPRPAPTSRSWRAGRTPPARESRGEAIRMRRLAPTLPIEGFPPPLRVWKCWGQTGTGSQN